MNSSKVTLSTKDELLSALDKLRESSVLVVGDLMLDRYIWGDVERISQEAPVPVLEVMRDEERLGGAGNVIANLLALGVKVTVCGFVGDDEAGRADDQDRPRAQGSSGSSATRGICDLD